jgi:hypothetical protein
MANNMPDRKVEIKTPAQPSPVKRKSIPYIEQTLPVPMEMEQIREEQEVWYCGQCNQAHPAMKHITIEQLKSEDMA